MSSSTKQSQAPAVGKMRRKGVWDRTGGSQVGVTAAVTTAGKSHCLLAEAIISHSHTTSSGSLAFSGQLKQKQETEIIYLGREWWSSSHYPMPAMEKALGSTEKFCR